MTWPYWLYWLLPPCEDALHLLGLWAAFVGSVVLAWWRVCPPLRPFASYCHPYFEENDVQQRFAKPSVEPLDSRNVPALTYNIDSTVIEVVGTAQADYVEFNIDSAGTLTIIVKEHQTAHQGSAIVWQQTWGFGAYGNWTKLKAVMGDGNDETLCSFSYTGQANEMSTEQHGQGDADTLRGANNADSLYGGTGDDRLYAFEGHNLLDGNSGHDSLSAGDGNDSLYGGGDNDTVWAGNGTDYVEGNDGDDQVHLDGDIPTPVDTCWGGSGTDTVWRSVNDIYWMCEVINNS